MNLKRRHRLKGIKARVVICILLVLLLGSGAFGEDRMKSPDAPKERHISRTNLRVTGDTTSHNPLSIFFDYSVRFFQTFISPVDGDRCSMYPTCSAYSREAIKKYGPIKGFIMTADRLMHEMDETRFAPLIKKGDSLRYYDPPENNDFWDVR